ncbi:MAG: serine/threonine protein kinase [Phormidium sp. GEM2.Bin31]|nr:MAG: serine/threonine protein kinase [Phormidium sp. GEM2.Bin31]
MSYCVNRHCAKPQNPDSAQYCQSCGHALILRDRYQVIQPLGGGGFAKTYLAVDRDLPSHPRCVVKQLHPQNRTGELGAKMLELFHREAENLHRLGQHPQIPTLFAHFEQKGYFYLVQEWIEGQTLSEELQNTGTFDESQIRDLLGQLLPVLDYIHEQHSIHRDIKPDNIMRRRRDGQLFLIDFGVVKVIQEQPTESSYTAVGSAEYMAPEQTRGQAFPASDLYSLGVTCARLMTGISPLELYDIVGGRWDWQRSLPLTHRISPQLTDVLNKLLETPLSERFHAAKEVIAALKTPTPPPAPEAPPTLAHPKPRQRPRLPKPEIVLERVPRTRPRLSLIDQLFYKTPDVPLPSEVGLDYSELWTLLRRQRWEAADFLTHKLLCRAAHGTPSGHLAPRDIEALPCTDLQTLDYLWRFHSGDRFGFTVQQQIYQQTGRDYPLFCATIGWKLSAARSPSLDFTYSLKAPVGHLPSRRWAKGFELWRTLKTLDDKLSQCFLYS